MHGKFPINLTSNKIKVTLLFDHLDSRVKPMPYTSY